jgi:hypothetical protein
MHGSQSRPLGLVIHNNRSYPQSSQIYADYLSAEELVADAGKRGSRRSLRRPSFSESRLQSFEQPR